MVQLKDKEIALKMSVEKAEKLYNSARCKSHDCTGDFNTDYPDKHEYALSKMDELGFSSYKAMEEALFERLAPFFKERAEKLFKFGLSIKK